MGPSIALSNVSLWRDEATAGSLGQGSIMPDLAFAGSRADVDAVVTTLAPLLPDFAMLDGYNVWRRGLEAKPRDGKLTAAFFSYVPYALFCLMPLFALYLKLLYLGSGRRYGEHLLFALHANGFAFAVLGVLILISPFDLGFISFLLHAWMVLYLPKAMGRVYGGSRAMTGLRWAVLTVLHTLSIGVALIATVGVAILR